MQRRDDRHPQLAQQRQHMAARRPSKNTELMLETNDIHVVDVQEIRRAQVGRQILFRDLKAHLRRIIITVLDIIDRHDRALDRGKFGGDGAAKVGRERGDAAFSWQVIAEKCDFMDAG